MGSSGVLIWVIQAFVYGCALLLLVMVGAAFYSAVVFPFTEEGKKAKVDKENLRKHIEASRRVELVNGRPWEIVTKPHTLVCDRKNGRYAAIIGHSMQNIPWMDQGKLTMRPRWVHLQPLTKEKRPAQSKQYWSASQNWDAIGIVELNWKERPARETMQSLTRNG